MIAKLFKIKCLTNMHVGNGEVNFNIIDNEVERDAVTKYPTINSSGVKGALREFFEVTYKKDSEIVNNIFGPEKGEGVPGKVKFLCANMLAIPMRASDSAAYYMVTTKKAVEAYNNLAGALMGKGAVQLDIAEGVTVEVEGEKCPVTESLKPFIEGTVAVMDDEKFGEPVLPVVARNRLDNGKSQNLWFEEIVPHESVFYFFAVVSDGDKEHLDAFVEGVNHKVVQFGGNATIGYGLCEVEAL